MAKKAKKSANIEDLLASYDIARAEAKDSKKEADDLNKEIKDYLGETEEVDTPEFICTYKYDKDKEVEEFDEEKFAEKEPKKYQAWQELKEDMEKMQKKYTKKTTVKGTRKLVVTRKNAEEE